jgi:hypothetical protein
VSPVPYGMLSNLSRITAGEGMDTGLECRQSGPAHRILLPLWPALLLTTLPDMCGHPDIATVGEILKTKAVAN